jgi:hypothetical protein
MKRGPEKREDMPGGLCRGPEARNCQIPAIFLDIQKLRHKIFGTYNIYKYFYVYFDGHNYGAFH